MRELWQPTFASATRHRSGRRRPATPYRDELVSKRRGQSLCVIEVRVLETTARRVRVVRETRLGANLRAARIANERLRLFAYHGYLLLTSRDVERSRG